MIDEETTVDRRYLRAVVHLDVAETHQLIRQLRKLDLNEIADSFEKSARESWRGKLVNYAYYGDLPNGDRCQVQWSHKSEYDGTYRVIGYVQHGPFRFPEYERHGFKLKKHARDHARIVSENPKMYFGPF
jgi:hypothetical protein